MSQNDTKQNMNGNKYLLIYHREDNDGVFSGSLFYDYLLNKLRIDSKNIHFLPADYNILSDFSKSYSDIETLKEKYDSIIMTDISFNDASYMKKLFKEYNNDFIWCDHHAPIIHLSHEKHFSETPGIRDTQRSAILNVWKYLYDQFDEAYNQKKVPELLRILSAYDSWTYEKEGYEFEYVRNINKAVTIKYNLDIYNVLPLVKMIRESYLDKQPSANMSGLYRDIPLIKELHEYGKKLNDYDDIINKNIIMTSGDCSWEVRFEDKDRGRPLFHKACAIFHQGATNSTMFKCLKNKGINHGLVFKHQPNGNWVLSMYNISDDEWTHCGDFLKERYNGGGHKGAAGCTLTQEQFIKILKTKTI